MDDIDESDCCGNGCANCVLNVKQTKLHDAHKSGKQNILGRYTKFLLINKTMHLPHVDNVWELHFKSIHSNNKEFMLDIKAGCHVMMRKSLAETDETRNKGSDVGKERTYLLRPYSPFWWDDLEMEFKILLNIIPTGPMSAYIKKMEINDEVEFRGPIGGTFVHHSDEKGDKCLLIISQGIAIAPSIPIVEDILNNECDMTRIVHIACFQDLKHVCFRDKLYDYSKYWNYQVRVYLSKELCDNTDCINNSKCLEMCKNFKTKLKYKDAIIPHRITINDFKEIVDNLGYTKENTCITICGANKFQNYFKELSQSVNCSFLEKNIYLL